MIQKALLKMNLSTAAGLNGIPIYFWKSFIPFFKNPLSYFFAFCKRGICSWKLEAFCCCSMLQGKRRSSKSFKLSSNLPYPKIFFLFEKVLYQIIERVFKQIIHEHQFGFRALRSTESNFLSCYGNVTTALEAGACVDVVFFYLAKPFFKVNHSLPFT